jgi:hypothetical protein
MRGQNGEDERARKERMRGRERRGAYGYLNGSLNGSLSGSLNGSLNGSLHGSLSPYLRTSMYEYFTLLHWLSLRLLLPACT